MLVDISGRLSNALHVAAVLKLKMRRWHSRPPTAISACFMVLLFAVSGASNALRKGGDATDFFDGGARALHGLPLYEGSSTAQGFIGPPFQAVMFIPFAALSDRHEPVARLLWFVLNLLMLGAGLACWDRACVTLVGGVGERRTISVLAALLAVGLPLQTNFEHQNMNALLLGLLGAGAWAIAAGHERAAGLSFGVAAALKVFPALLIVYFALRGRWRACASSMVTLVVLTCLPMLFYGPAGFVHQIGAWAGISSGGWPGRFNNQSLISAIDRLTGAWNVQGTRTAADAPVAFAIFVAAACVLIASTVYVFSRSEGDDRHLPIEVTTTVLLSVLLSPIAWDHYWVLAFPAFLLLRYAARPELLGRTATATFWIAAILLTGISRVTVGVWGWNVARRLSVSTICALVLFAALLRLHQLASSGEALGRARGLPQVGA